MNSRRIKATFKTRKAYLAADANDPVALVTAIAEAEKEEKKEDICDLRLFILENQEAFLDHREILAEKTDIGVSEMCPMGAAESNMNLFSRSLKKVGYGWSSEGLESKISAMTHHFEDTSIEAIQQATGNDTGKTEPVKYPSFAYLMR